jgi:hypothetical protein
MMRIQIKDDLLRYSAVIDMLGLGYKVNVDNRDGDCFYVWTDGSRRVDISHWTNDNPILEVDKGNYRWFINCL